MASKSSTSKKWPAEKRREALRFLATHPMNETKAKFAVSDASLYVWMKDPILTAGIDLSKRPKVTGQHPKTGKHRKANGDYRKALMHDMRDMPAAEALTHLELWRKAYLKEILRDIPSSIEVLEGLKKLSQENPSG